VQHAGRLQLRQIFEFGAQRALEQLQLVGHAHQV